MLEFAFLGDVPTGAVVDFASQTAQNPDKILNAVGPEFFAPDVIKQLWIDTQSYDGRRKLEFAVGYLFTAHNWSFNCVRGEKT